ncbi:exocyst complex component exo84 [Teratosphaeriaceae sp. CCFEE 6253]|nr:exocyst complex component exo84 [Teratosphaeriaceae sp. CCFEE 6253]
MSEGKGISLRRKKTTRPTISAPRQISQSNTAAQQPSRDRSADSREPSLWETQTNTSNHSGTGQRTGRPGFGGDKTSDLVKRRYSTRFAGGVPQYGQNGGAEGGLAPPVPAMPSLPAQYARPQSRSNEDRSPSREGRSPSRDRGGGRPRVDVRALKDANLQPEQYVQSLLTDATDDDIRVFQDELQSVKAHTSSDLQHNVYQNRTQFIKISKEADKLKTEMRTLRTLMSELTSALGHATSAGGIDELGGAGSRLSMLSIADKKRANRSSVANLEAMWSSHLQTLWKRVEGSQKYLPALPGRHIVIESQRWVELNAANWKPRRRVALVLLNDHVLVASEKKRADPASVQNGQQQANGAPKLNGDKRSSIYQAPPPVVVQTQTMLVAERCWPLQDVLLVDIGANPTMSRTRGGETTTNKTMANAINIRAGSESLTYATTDSAEKAGLLVAFRKAQEDQRKLLAAEHGARERRLDELALLTGRDPRLLKKAAAEQLEIDRAAAGGAGLGRTNSVLIDADGRQQSVRWVEAQVDGLDIDIALQRFEEAVARVEKLRKLARSVKGNAAAQAIILAKVDERAAWLAGIIARRLVQTSAGAERTKGCVAWLLRLGCEEMARTRYLAARAETLRLRARQVPFVGALPPYVRGVAYATFTLLLHTFRTFGQAFPAGSASAVVKWATERVEEFNATLARQLESVERGGEVWRECEGVVREQAECLKEVGVDFGGLVGRGVFGDGTGSRRGTGAGSVAGSASSSLKSGMGGRQEGREAARERREARRRDKEGLEGGAA